MAAHVLCTLSPSDLFLEKAYFAALVFHPPNDLFEDCSFQAWIFFDII